MNLGYEKERASMDMELKSKIRIEKPSLSKIKVKSKPKTIISKELNQKIEVSSEQL